MKKETLKKAKELQELKAIKIRRKKLILNVELSDIWGGDGAKRIMTIKTPRLSRTTKTTKERSTMPDFVDEREVKERKFDLKEVEVKTFHEQNEKPILYLGRKVKGTIRHIGRVLARMQNPLIPSMTFWDDCMSVISVLPEIIELDGNNWLKEDNENYYLGSSGQQMARGRAFVPIYFDAFKKVKTKVEIIFPSVFERQILTIVDMLPATKFGNRKMTKMKIINQKLVGA